MKTDGMQLSALDRGLLALEKMQAKLAAVERAKTEPIAIIGLGCRFPGGGADPESFWQALRDGVDAVRKIPPERWPEEAMPEGHPGTRWAALLDAVDGFDAAFFGVAPREAMSLDPQQRLLLEVAWEALENAGQVPERLMGSRTGVFIGMSTLDYQQRIAAIDPGQADAYFGTGNMLSTAAGRLSYVFGIQGPCMSVDTACSSSLVAIHLACQSLRSGESELALAGGVNLILSPKTMYMAGQTQALSPDGRCKTFDAGANGYVRGEGSGLVVLKRLSDAERDGDRIWGLIRGSAVNQDGRSPGLTVPNILAQQALLRQALEQARVSAQNVGYIEAHGTGTSLGDPIEVEALKEVIGQPRPDGLVCALGSVKTNFGHLEAAAGVAGLMKAVLVLDRGVIPRHLHFQALNPRISLEGTPLVIAAEERAWPANEKTRYAGVNSFGISGTNAHVVLEEAPKAKGGAPAAAEGTAFVLPLSAKTPEALSALASSYGRFLAQDSPESLDDIAYTASVRRTHHDHRLAVAGRSRQELSDALQAYGRGERPAGIATGQVAAGVQPRAVFVFSGQGSQWVGMGRQLLEQEPAFRAVMEACDALVKRYAGWSLLAELAAPEATSRLGQTAIAQPALFAMQVALCEVLKAWGITPDAVVGHSVGEIAAAHIAGALSLDEAVRLVCSRGRVMQQATGLGKMASVALSAEEASQALRGYEDRLSIAAINDPGSVVLSGDAAALAEVMERLQQQGANVRMLRVDYAFHSPQMAPFQAELKSALGRIELRRAERPMYSTVTGAKIEGEALEPGYWARNVREPVQLAGALESAIRDGYRLFVEVGPHPVLTANVQECLRASTEPGHALPTLRRGQEERPSLLQVLGGLYTHGYAVDWKRHYPEGGRVVSLPVYPWQRKRYWIEVKAATWVAEGAVSSGHPMLGMHIPAAGVGAVFETALSVEAAPYLSDHRVFDEVVVPGTALLELAHASAITYLGTERVEVTGLVVQAPLVLPEHERVRVQVVLDRGSDASTPVTVYSQAAGAKAGEPWTVHAQGYVQSVADEAEPARVDVADMLARCRTSVSVVERYAAFAEAGVTYGPAFHGMAELWQGAGEAVCRVALPTAAGDLTGAYGMHPALLDAALQTLGAAHVGGSTATDEMYLPFEVTSYRLWERGVTEAWVHARRTEGEGAGTEVVSGDITIVDSEGRVLAEVKGLRLKRATASALQRGKPATGSGWLLGLSWKEAPLSRAVEEKSEPGHWLVLTDGSALGRSLAERLRGQGARCVAVARGAETVQCDEHTWVVDPRSPRALGQVVAGVEAGGLRLRGVVCLWAAEPLPEGSPAERAEALAVAGLHLVQALAGRADASPARLWWVTQGAQAVTAGEPVDVAQAPLWGLGRVVMQEHPEMGCTLVDLDAGPGAETGTEALWQEVWRSDNNEETQVAWRRGQRYGARLVRAGAGLEPREPLRLEPASTALITGGLGALGLHVARWLVEQRQVRHVVLVGRSAAEGARLAAVEELRSTGAEVTVAQIDIADRAQVQALLAAIPPELPLRAIVHAAGVLDDGVLTHQDAPRFAAVLAPKVHGAWNLHTLTQDLPLDMFVLFSSAASLLGSAGQGNYAAGNAFLDALAQQRLAEGSRAHSIAWGPWSAGGMAAKLDEAQQGRLQRQGVGTISPAQGLSVLEQVLTRPEAQIGVLPLDLRALGKTFSTGPVPPLWRALVKARPERAPGAPKASSGGWSARLAALSPAERAREVEAAVRAELGRALSLPSASDIPEGRPLQELGLDSLMAVELRNGLAARVGKLLPATLVFDHPTVNALTRYLLDKVIAVDTARAVAQPSPSRAADNEPIAVVGIGCRYPGGVRDVDSFWSLLERGVDAIREVPRERWDVDAYYNADPDVPGTMITRSGGFLDEVELFDPAFFGISPREAVKMDPQQRLLLETTWEALEHAGLLPEELMDSDTGVFVGMMYHDYASLGTRSPEQLDGYVGTGNAGSVASGRISYLLGLKGPSLTLDTACSSSLVTLHLACQSLRSGECSAALAGGVALMLTPAMHVEFSRLRGLALDGRCKTFDASADGVAWSEGCGMVVLKRLSDAQRDGDPILGLIRGSAVNQDGRSNGLTAPNGPSQEAVIRRALEQAGVAAAAVGYVEAHGTGTPLGDTIEAQALGEVLRQGRPLNQPVVVGSVKSNMGHTQAAAGAAGVIKALLSMKHGVIPPSLHFKEPNPRIPWSDLPVRVAARAEPWPSNGEPRIAGVSSFGISGTNAHLVLQEAPTSLEAEPAYVDRVYVLPLSAKSPEALTTMAQAHGRFLAAGEPGDLRDIAYTASVRRTHYSHRLAVVGRSRRELSEALNAYGQGEHPAGMAAGQVAAGVQPKVVFIFPGQGSQWVGMGRELLEQEPAFRTAMEACERAIQKETGWSLLEELSADEGRSRLAHIDVVQPVLFAIEVALAALWSSWGIEPDAVVGHSMGEVAAAHVAGALSLEDAARIICRRSRLLRRVSGQGAMALVELPLEQARAALAGYEDRLAVAVSNSPRSTVLSGEPTALDELMAKLAQEQIFCRRVKVDVASHSPQMDPLLDELVAELSEVEPRAARVAMHSTVHGQPCEGPELGPRYWAQNLREPVLFAQAIERLANSGPTLFVEMSPHPILLPALEEALQQAKHGGVAVGSLRREQEERRALLESLGALYVHGAPASWKRLYPSGGTCVTLPAYPWQRQRYWFETGPQESATPWQGSSTAPRGASGHPLLGVSFTSSKHAEEHIWERALGVAALPYLADHRVRGEVVFPAGGYVEMALAAGAEVLDGAEIDVEAISIERMLGLPEQGARLVQVVLTEEGADQASFQIASRAEGDTRWQTHAAGRLLRSERAGRSLSRERPPRERVHGSGATMSVNAFYADAQERGLEYGPAFQGMVGLWAGADEALAEVRLPEGVKDTGYLMHPALLEACSHISAGLFGSTGDSSMEVGTYVPIAIERVRMHQAPGRRAWVAGARRAEERSSDRERVFDFRLLDDEGRLLAEIEGFRVRQLPAGGTATRDELDGCVYELAWRRAEPLPDASPREEGTWLILSDRGGVGAALGDRLRADGKRCVRVLAGDGYTKLDPDLYQIDPASPEDYGRVLREALAKEEACPGVLHLFSLDSAASQEATPESLDDDLLRGSISAAYLVQAIARHGGQNVPRLWLVTRGAQEAGAGGRCAVSQAPLWGLGRTLALELPELMSTQIDLSPSPGQGDADLLLRELASREREDQIALRDDGRRVARVTRSRFEAQDAAPAIGLHPDASYLITGGLGGPGLALAQWMVDQGARHIALLDAHLPSDAAQGAIRAMEEAGAQIERLQADVSQRSDVARSLDELSRRLPPLRGVVHAAAVLDDHTLLELSEESFRKVFAPKARGAWNLHALTQDKDLDFFVMYSSAAALFGSPGQGSYAAANALLDALCHERRRTRRPAMSIQWGAFSGAGPEEAQGGGSDRSSGRGASTLTPEEGLRALERLFARPRVEVGVARFDAGRWLELYPRAAEMPFFAELAKNGARNERPKARAGHLRAALLRTPASEQQALLEHALIQHVGRVLRLDVSRLDRGVPLLSLGMDSLMALELRNRIEHDLTISFRLSELLQGQSVRSLSARMLERVRGDIPAAADGSSPGSFAAATPGRAEGESDIRFAIRDVVELDLAQIWQEVLGVASVAFQDDFFAIGGDAPLAARLLSRIRERFGQELSMAALSKASTLGALAQVLRKLQAASTAWSPLVPIQPAGKRRPIYMVHALMGTVMPYVPLARRLGTDRPFYGLQGRGLFDDQESLSRIDDIASLYIEAIRSVQPEGPYHVGGWSFGGFVAMEMARQLVDQGHSVGLVAVLDSLSPSVWELSARDDAASAMIAIGRGVGLDLPPDAFHDLEPRQRLVRLCAILADKGLWPLDLDPERIAAHIDAHILAGRRYVARVASPMTFFRATAQNDILFTRGPLPNMGAEWRAYSPHAVEVIDVPGNHLTMVLEPHVEVLGGHLRRCLLAADGVPDPSARISTPLAGPKLNGKLVQP